MGKPVEIILEWKFEPIDFFEEKVEYKINEYSVSLEEGVARISITDDVYKSIDEYRVLAEQIYGKLELIFKSAFIVNQKKFIIHNPNVTVVDDDNKKNIYLNPVVSVASISTHVEFQIIDKDGKIVSDSRRDRINKIKDTSLLGLNLSINDEDEIAMHLIGFYYESFDKPERILTSLYDLHKALVNELKGEDNVQDILGIPKSKQVRIRYITNVLPLKEGRHPGENIGELRNATNEEIKEAREIAKEELVQYLHYKSKRKKE